ncbi:hypothetical protein N657DRAFT_248109 [Parathielavia appendiculata]|uniref:Uncharacterized protein n=1 Tax=Parathielavia appendiculata TaxID=2587402 RepID=A0AAN6TT84_9PEZI|nr:hypothetical protein N657DRAFT_248109 [Parathielavia appendiculata]
MWGESGTKLGSPSESRGEMLLVWRVACHSRRSPHNRFFRPVVLCCRVCCYGFRPPAEELSHSAAGRERAARSVRSRSTALHVYVRDFKRGLGYNDPVGYVTSQTREFVGCHDLTNNRSHGGRPFSVVAMRQSAGRLHSVNQLARWYCAAKMMNAGMAQPRVLTSRITIAHSRLPG